jgi:hypothetical protein
MQEELSNSNLKPKKEGKEREGRSRRKNDEL